MTRQKQAWTYVRSATPTVNISQTTHTLKHPGALFCFYISFTANRPQRARLQISPTALVCCMRMWGCLRAVLFYALLRIQGGHRKIFCTLLPLMKASYSKRHSFLKLDHMELETALGRPESRTQSYSQGFVDTLRLPEWGWALEARACNRRHDGHDILVGKAHVSYAHSKSVDKGNHERKADVEGETVIGLQPEQRTGLPL